MVYLSSLKYILNLGGSYMKHLKRLFLSLFSVILSLMIFSSVFAEETDKIRVGFLPQMYGFYTIEENGTLSGYNYDYLALLSQYTNFIYEFVIIEDEDTNAAFIKALNMIENGELDLLGTVFHSDLTENLYEYGAKNYSVARYSLCTLRNNNSITVDNYFLYDTLSVAYASNYSVYNQAFLDTFQIREIGIDSHMVDTQDQAYELLLAEEVDAMLCLDISHLSEYVETITPIYRIPMYFISTKGNTELMAQIDEAIYKIESAEPDIHQRLLAEHFGLSYDGDLLLTSEEAALLSNIDTLKVGLISNTLPYQFENGLEQPTEGISIEILNNLAEILGINFHYVWAIDGLELEKMLQAQEIDICATMPYDFGAGAEFKLTLSRPYLSAAAVWLHPENDVTNPEIFYYLVSDNILFFQKKEMTILFEVENTISQLSEGNNISLFTDPYVAQYYLSALDITNVELQTISNVLCEFAIGVGNHMDHNLVGLLNRAILHLDPFEVDEIIYKNVNSATHISVSAFLKQNAEVLLFSMFLFFSLIITALVHYSKKMRELSQRDGLTKLYNAGYFHKTTAHKLEKIHKGVLILIDIDYFKSVNDTHGHQQGDAIIITVAQQLADHFTKHSMVARLGGDEFVIFLEGEQEKSNLETLSQHILKNLSENHTGIPTTLSIGGYFFHEPIAYENLYRYADQVLYQVKEKGRNGYLFQENTPSL